MKKLTENEKYMKIALKEAKKAYDLDEVPIGAVIVKDGVVLAKAKNLRNKTKCATSHAEVLAINKACKKLGDWRLEGAKMYVTLEPCPMCAGAALSARVKRIVYGASDKNCGALGTVVDLNEHYPLHKAEVERGFMEKECADMLTDFFRDLRKKRKETKTDD